MLADVRLGAGELVRLDHVSCSYARASVIDDVTLTVTDGEFVGIVGPSGGGKTTVLRAMLGTLAPTYGRVVRRDDISVGYVPQVEAIDWSFPVTVGDVVEMTLPRPRFGRLARRDKRRVAHVLDRLGIADLTRRQISALSGGQQQRVFLARALVHDPELLVLDEPAGGVDVATRHEVLHVLGAPHHDRMSIVLTTPD